MTIPRVQKTIRLTIPIPPSANRYWRHAVVHTKRGPIVTTYVSEEAKAYKESLRLALSRKGIVMLVGPVKFTVRLYRPRRAGDLGNRLKVLEDMLEGVAYVNDSQIAEIYMLRRTDPARPRVEVDIEAIDDPDEVRMPALPFDESSNG